MASPGSGREPDRKRRTGGLSWLALLLLIGSVYAFWILPRQLPHRPVKVEFVAGKKG